MYFFDKEDFKCDQIPGDWEDYATTIRAVFDSTIKCLANLINTTEMSESLKTILDTKLQELYDFYNDEFKVKLSLLITELSESPAGSTCFNKSIFNNYLASFNTANDLVLEINGLLTFGEDVTIYDFNTNVDNTLIYPTSGSSYNKVTKCVGVYMKQMDFGSEFIGSVKIIENAPPVSVYFEEWRGYSDGEWFITRY